MTTPINFSTQQLIDAFHQSLHGNSTAEIKKSFHAYLNSLKTSTNGDSEKLSAVVEGIIPQNFWESILKVDIIVHYELFIQSLEVLKSENKVLVGKVIKSAWFIKKLLETFTAQQFVDELFCFTSVSSRTKIINRLIKYNKNEEFGKQLFEAYARKYGLRAAKQLLPLCPLHVVEDVVINKKIKPSTSTIRKITKDLELAKYFYKTFGYRNKKEIKCIARNNLPFLIEFLVDSNAETFINLGSSTTHKLIKTYKNYLINNPEYLDKNILNLKRVFFDLKEEYQQLVFKLIVARGHVDNFEGCARVLSPLPMQKQRAIYLSAFKEVVKCSLEEKPDCIDESFLRVCEDVDERDKYAELAYSTKKEDRWIKYMRIEKSVPLLKEKISFVSKPLERENFVKVLVKTCRINNDEQALLDVFKYVTKRFRNDKEDVRGSFCRELLKTFNLRELSREHWKYINELEKLFEVNNENFSRATEIIKEQIILCLKSKEPIEPLLAKLYEREYCISFDYFHCDSAIMEKELILLSIAYWNGQTEDEENDTKFKTYLQLLSCVQSYNSRHKDDPINIKETFPIKWMVERLEKGSRQWLYSIDSLFTYCIFGDAEPEDQKEAIRVFFKKQQQEYDVLLHFIKNKPNVFMDNFEAFLDSRAVTQIFKSKILLKYYRRLLHLDLNQNVFEHFKTILYKKDHFGNKDQIIQRKIESLKALAVCMDEEGYLNLIEQYRPTEAHLDTKSDESKELYQYREAICESIVNLSTASKAIDALLPFCVGDYLKFCLKGLYHFVFHMQECKVPQIIDALKAKAVSVRKHSAFLSLATQGQKYNLQFFEKYIENEQNVSVVAHVLKSIFKYFTKNLDRDFFEVFKVLLMKADKKDEETFNLITKECILPEIFVAEYVEFVWSFIESFGKEDFDFEHTKFALLCYLKERDYILLDDAFLDRILKQNFLKENKFVSMDIVTDVAVRYLIYCNSAEKIKFRLKLVFEMLHDLKNAHKNKALNSCAAFVEKFSIFAVTQKIPTIELIMEFKEHFNGFTDAVESFNEHVDLDLLELHIKSLSSENYVEYFSKSIAHFLNDFEQKYGIGLLIYSKHKISHFIKLRLKKLGLHLYADNIHLFLEHLYSTSQSIGTAILVTELLVKFDDNINNHPETRHKHESLIEKLKCRKEPVVKVLLTSYFRNLCQ